MTDTIRLLDFEDLDIDIDFAIDDGKIYIFDMRLLQSFQKDFYEINREKIDKLIWEQVKGQENI